jgi:hypothetical protein
MAIVTLDQALAGMKPPVEFIKASTGTQVAGRPTTIWYRAGVPGAGVASNAGIGGEILVSPVSGQLPFENPVSGNSYLARICAQATIAGQLVLIDKLWVNSGIAVNTTATQVFTGAAQIPNRDANGSNVGDGVYAGIEVSGSTGAGTPTITVGYTNTAGQSKTATNAYPTASSTPAGTFFPVSLAAGDKGIQKAESITLSATWTSGTIHVVLYRIIARLELTIGNVPNALDLMSSGFPRIYDDSVLTMLFIPSSTSSTYITGNLVYTQG